MNWIITKNTCIITNNHHNQVRILHAIYVFCINELKMVPLNVSLSCKGVMWKSHRWSPRMLVHSIWWHSTTPRVPHGRPYMWFRTFYNDVVGLCVIHIVDLVVCHQYPYNMWSDREITYGIGDISMLTWKNEVLPSLTHISPIWGPVGLIKWYNLESV